MNMEAPKPKRQTPLDAAIAYHALNLRVVLLHNLTVTRACSCKLGAQCLHAGKHPRLGGWNKPGAGMLETADDIRDAFSRYPRANVGVITGGPQYSSIICIDVDPKHDGNTSLEKLFAAHASFPPTWQARTGSGGSHYLFKHPGPGWIVRNSQADDKKHHPKLGTGLDVKGDRGQFVAPPSAHASGKRYEWVNAPGGDVGLAELPEWLLELIAEKVDSGKGKRRGSAASHRKTSAPSRTTSWAQKALVDECNRVLNAPSGSGNDVLNQAAFNLGQIVGGGALSEDEAVSNLLDAATSGGRRPREEAAKTIHSGIKSGKASPRTPPERDLHRNHNHDRHSSSTSPTEQPGGHDTTNALNEHDDDPHRLARAFVERFGMYQGKQRLWKWREEWYAWGAASKCYREVPKSEIKDQLCGFIKMEFDRVSEESGEKVKKVKAETINNTLNALSSMCLLKTNAIQSMPAWLGLGTPPAYIPLANGLLDYHQLGTAESTTDILHPHTPEWFSVDTIPVDFDIKAECPRWKAFLERNFEGDTQRVNVLQEWFGYCLTPDTGFQKFLMLNGEGANGKSVICAVLAALLGIDNVATVPLELFGERFQLTTTLGKLANISADVGEIDRAAEGQLKSFVSGDMMYFDRKGMPPLNAYPTARLVLATNNLPRFNDKSSGIWRRMILMPLTTVITEAEQVHGMDKPTWWKAQGELSGILNWALVGRDRLYSNNRFSKSEQGTKALEEYRVEVNPVRQFFDEELVATEGNETANWTSCKDIYKAYGDWCKHSGHKPMSKTGFFREVNRHCTRCAGWRHVESKQGYEGTKRVWGYDNIAVNGEQI